MSYVYLQSERTLWTVGFYDPDGEWQAESDHSKEHLAAERVAYLNGGGLPDASKLRESIRQLEGRLEMLETGMRDMRSAVFAEWSEGVRIKGLAGTGRSARHILQDDNWTQGLVDIINQAENGDTVLVNTPEKAEMGQRAMRRMGKSLLFEVAQDG
jgi:hypothetical protein